MSTSWFDDDPQFAGLSKVRPTTANVTALPSQRLSFDDAWREAMVYAAAECWDAAHKAHKAWSAYTDLSWVANGVAPVAAPAEFLARRDGVCAFYRGRLNVVYGNPEAGKTWVANTALVGALAQGRRCAIIDVDHNGAASIAGALIRLGASPAVLMDRECFRLAEPEDRDDLLTVVRDLAEWAPDGVVVVDSLGEIFPMLGVTSNDNDEVTAGVRLVLAPLARAGAAVVAVDHMPKGEGGAGFAIGAMAKKRAVNGVMLHAQVVTGHPLAPGRVGKVKLTVHKDRPGRVREHAGAADAFGVFVLDSTVAGRSSVTVWPPDPVSVSPVTGKYRPTTRMAAVSAWCAAHAVAASVSKADIERGVGGNKQTTASAVDTLIAEGFMREVPTRPHATFQHVRPYTEAADPLLADRSGGAF